MPQRDAMVLMKSSEIIDFRNFLAHGYHLVDHSIVWKIATTDVPRLQEKLQELIAERSGIV